MPCDEAVEGVMNAIRMVVGNHQKLRALEECVHILEKADMGNTGSVQALASDMQRFETHMANVEDELQKRLDKLIFCNK